MQILKYKQRILNLLNRKLIGPAIKYIFLKLALDRKYRFLNTNPAAIGHLCGDVDCFLKERVIERYPFRGVLLANKNIVSNATIAKLWSANEGLVVLTSPIICYLTDYLRVYWETNFDCSKYIALHGSGKPAEAHKIYNKYGDNKNMIVWMPELRKKAQSLFDQIFPNLNVDKLVALHVRDSQFDANTGNENLKTQKHRNSKIESYNQIIKFLTISGYVVVRIGEYAEAGASFGYCELPPMSRADRDLMNVFIISECAFLLGSASGPVNMAAIWGTPAFLINMFPYDTWRHHSRNSMSIPKLLAKDGKVLTIDEIYKGKYNFLTTDAQYTENRLTIIDNLADDCIEDFLEFCEIFVNKNYELRRELEQSPESLKCKSICPAGAFDREAVSLYPRRFLARYRLV